jgi:hypothetical protein
MTAKGQRKWAVRKCELLPSSPGFVSDLKANVKVAIGDPRGSMPKFVFLPGVDSRTLPTIRFRFGQIGIHACVAKTSVVLGPLIRNIENPR